MKDGVFVIIPAYNEANVLIKTINDLLPYNYEIIVVNDGSTDDTEKIIKDLPVYYIAHCTNLGQGAALQTGLDFAIKNRAAYFVTFDADGQHKASDIPVVIDRLYTSNADVALGSRFLPGAQTNIYFGRKMLLKLARFINFMVTGLFLSDAHNGFRVFNAKAASAIKIYENGMSHATEIIAEIRRQQLKYIEVPVEVLYTGYSRKKGQGFLNSFKILQDIILHKIFR